MAWNHFKSRFDTQLNLPTLYSETAQQTGIPYRPRVKTHFLKKIRKLIVSKRLCPVSQASSDWHGIWVALNAEDSETRFPFRFRLAVEQRDR